MDQEQPSGFTKILFLMHLSKNISSIDIHKNIFKQLFLPNTKNAIYGVSSSTNKNNVKSKSSYNNFIYPNTPLENKLLYCNIAFLMQVTLGQHNVYEQCWLSDTSIQLLG